MGDNADHIWTSELIFGDSFTSLKCNVESKKTQIKFGNDYDYCPFCGDEL